MYDMMNGIGAHEVVIESPRHDWDFAEATPQETHDMSRHISRVSIHCVRTHVFCIP
jgi:galactose-1-phosphate uridylyltransferase